MFKRFLNGFRACVDDGSIYVFIVYLLGGIMGLLIAGD